MINSTKVKFIAQLLTLILIFILTLSNLLLSSRGYFGYDYVYGFSWDKDALIGLGVTSLILLLAYIIFIAIEFSNFQKSSNVKAHSSKDYIIVCSGSNSIPPAYKGEKA